MQIFVIFRMIILSEIIRFSCDFSKLRLEYQIPSLFRSIEIKYYESLANNRRNVTLTKEILFVASLKMNFNVTAWITWPSSNKIYSFTTYGKNLK